MLNQNLLAAHPETLVILGRHGSWQADQFSLDLSDKYIVGGREFFPDFQTIETMQREIRMMDHPLTLDSDGQLQHNLDRLLRDWPEVKLIPLSCCGLSSAEHEEIGVRMKDFLIDSPKRIGILALRQEYPCPAWSILTGVIDEIQMKELNVANQAKFYGS